MARIRTLKPEVLEDANTAELSDAAFRLFVSAIVLADDHGNLQGDERWLKSQVWWAHPSPPRLAEILREMRRASLVTQYIVRGQQYLHIRGWSKHQRIDNAGKPRVPRPDDAEASILPVKDDDPDGESEDVLRESRRNSANRGGSPLDLRPPIPTSDPDPELCDSRESPQEHREFVASAIPAAMKLVLSEPKPKKRKSPEVPRPEGWAPSEAHRELARTLGVDCASEAAKFVDWTDAKGRRYVDWDAGFRTWLRGAKPSQSRGQQPAVGRANPLPPDRYGVGDEEL